MPSDTSLVFRYKNNKSFLDISAEILFKLVDMINYVAGSSYPCLLLPSKESLQGAGNKTMDVK